MNNIEVFDRELEWTIKDVGSFQTGDRNNFVFTLASKLHKKGVDKNNALSEISNRFHSKDFTTQEIRSCVNSAYKGNGQAIEYKPSAAAQKIQDIVTRPLNEAELAYWNQYKITPEILNKYQVLAVDGYVIGKHKETSEPLNPIFCYRLNKNTHKVYRPLRKEGENKFMWLGKKPENWFFGLEFCKGSQEVFITAGEKDVLTLTGQGKEAFTLNSETATMPANIAEKLKKQYQKIIVLYDNDATGIKGSRKMYEDFGFNRGILPEDIKDISDLIRAGRSMNEVEFEVNNEKKSDLIKPNLQDIPLFIKVENFIQKSYDLKYNEVSNEVECRKKGDKEFGPLNENNLFRELQHNRFKMSLTNLISMLKSDFVPVINPFKTYFESLTPWNESDPDHINILANYVSAADQQEFNYHFKKMLVRTVACALDEKFYNKHAFIIVGYKHHTGKSWFIRFLCPPVLKDYSSEDVSNVEKDGQIALSENIIINIDDLAMLSKVEVNNLKAFFSKDYVKVRHPYGKKAIRTPRRASFFGSTNNEEFLTDETGSVRWICFEVDHFDFEYSNKIDINQVWAQAYTLWKKNFECILTPEDLIRNEERNKKHQKRTIEMELIQEIFQPGTKENYDYKLTPSQIIRELEAKFPLNRYLPNIITMGKALTLLGFQKGSDRIDGYSTPVKIYYLKMIPGNILTTLLQTSKTPDDEPF